MKSETARETAERVVAKHLGPREANPLMQQIGRIYERLIDDFEASLNAERERAFDQGFILAVAEIMRQHGEDVIARDVMRANPIKDWSVIDEHDRDALAPIFEHEKMQAAFEGVNSNAE